MRLDDHRGIAAITEKQAHYVAIVAMLVGLVACLELGLIGALLGGLLVHELVHAIAPRITYGARGATGARMVSVGLIATLVIGALVAAGFGASALFRSEGASPAALLDRLADIIATSRGSLPQWIGQYVPEDAETLRQTIVDWLHAHAAELQHAGQTFGVTLLHILIGMVIGAIICLREARGVRHKTVLLREASERVRTLAQAFRSVVFAQVKISAINTVLTAIYLAAVLPLLGVQLPFTKALITLCFIGGLLPVFGNLISNTVIVIVSLTQGFAVAVGSLVFLIVIHKLEYFLNARIVGGEIKAAAWELLCAMLAFEAAFGVPGLIAAPIFYAYGKAELRQLGLI
ncbi:MAG TPA: AI-2E family transporter [Burkholderiales bacterium]|nr:AI-2E family transporter [Burkholderiales bacterium]